MIAVEEALEIRSQLQTICRRLDSLIERSTQPNRGLGIVINQDFDRFFSQYPRHVKREAALRVWLAMNPTPECIREIMAALPRHKASWAGKDLDFVPLAESWLMDKRWLDKLDSLPLAPEKPKLCPRCRVGGADFRPVVLSKDQKTLICRRCRDEEDV